MRQLRREAGFGCCVCGNPIIQYHHIIEWSKDQHFRPEDMMVLCPTHHDKATKHAMPEVEQRRFKAKPQNIERGLVDGKLAIKQDYCALEVGSVMVVGEGPFIKIDGEDILALYLGERNFEISVTLYDETDTMLLHIDRNEWISGDPLPWDIEADWQRLTLRERYRRISLSLDATKIPMQARGQLWRSGKHIGFGASDISIGGKTAAYGSGIAELALVGTHLALSTDKLELVPSSPHGAFLVSWPNRRERLWKARDQWRKIKEA
jgi:hypothetical protein